MKKIKSEEFPDEFDQEKQRYKGDIPFAESKNINAYVTTPIGKLRKYDVKTNFNSLAGVHLPFDRMSSEKPVFVPLLQLVNYNYKLIDNTSVKGYLQDKIVDITMQKTLSDLNQ